MARTKGEATRARVIEGALQAMCAHGVGSVTTRQIAAACGMPLATLHYHFASKSALLLAVLETLIDDMTASLRAEQKPSAGLAECLASLLPAAWRLVERTRALQIVQYELTLYALREQAEWLAERQYDRYVAVYRDILLAAVAQSGELDEPGCAALARFILAGIDGLILQDLARPDPERARQGVRALLAAALPAGRQAICNDCNAPSSS